MDASAYLFLLIVFAPAIFCFSPLLYILFVLIRNKLRKKNQRKLKEINYIFAGLGVIFGGLYLLVIMLIDSSMCGERYSEKLYSSDGEYSVQAFEINCGATTDFSTGVIIVNEKTHEKNGVFDFNGSINSVKAYWVDNRTVKVRYTYCRNIRDQENTWKDVKIIYDKQCE